MTGLVRKATLLTLCGVLAASAAMAGVPSSANSTKPAFIKLVGQKTGVADAVGTFTVTVRDLGNNLIANSTVVVDFANCVRIRAASPQPFAGLTVDNLARTVRAQTNGSGVATFDIVGGSCNSGNLSGSGANCGRIFADGVLLGSVTVAAFDQDGVGGVTLSDLSAWGGDFLSGTYYGRSDYNGDGTLSLSDLSIWGGVFLAANSSASGAYNASWTCP
jgi:hypothetical protein